MRKFQIAMLTLVVPILFSSCAKSRAGGEGGEGSKTNNTELENNAANKEVNNGIATLPDRIHVYAILDTKPPEEPTETGTTIVFNKVGANIGNCYNKDNGTFRACRKGYYTIDAAINWTGSNTTTVNQGICQAFLYVTGAPFPVMMTSGVYLKGQPCSAQVHITVGLEEGQTVYVSGNVTLPALNLVNATYTYAYLAITENKL